MLQVTSGSPYSPTTWRARRTAGCGLDAAPPRFSAGTAASLGCRACPEPLRSRSLASRSSGAARPWPSRCSCMNLALYVYTVIAARLLGPQAYGALAALMAVLLVVSVLQLGIQATAARRIAADPGHVAQIEREILGLTYRAAAVVGLVLLLLTPLIDRILRLDSLVDGVGRGSERGSDHHPRRADRRAPGRAPLVAGVRALPRERRPPTGPRHRPDPVAPDGAGRHVGVLLGALVPVVLGAPPCAAPATPGLVSDTHATGPIVREILSNSQTLLAFLSLMQPRRDPGAQHPRRA